MFTGMRNNYRMACEKRPTLSANRILGSFSIIKAKQGITLGGHYRGPVDRGGVRLTELSPAIPCLWTTIVELPFLKQDNPYISNFH